jgi:hypothetical protein
MLLSSSSDNGIVKIACAKMAQLQYCKLSEIHIPACFKSVVADCFELYMGVKNANPKINADAKVDGGV